VPSKRVPIDICTLDRAAQHHRADEQVRRAPQAQDSRGEDVQTHDDAPSTPRRTEQERREQPGDTLDHRYRYGQCQGRAAAVAREPLRHAEPQPLLYTATGTLIGRTAHDGGATVRFSGRLGHSCGWC
jgi:hypothetical protein